MVKIGTSCTNCCFLDENTNCKLGLLDVFKDRGAEITIDNDSVSLDRLCQYKRQSDWQSDKSDNEKNDIIKQEVYIKGTIVLITDNEDDLQNTISKIKNISNFKVIILYSNIKISKMLEICGNTKDIEYKMIMIADTDISKQIYLSLKFAKNGYLFIIDCSKEIDDNMIDKVNTIVNKKMFRVLHIEGTDGIHQSVNMIHLYKWVKGDLEIPIKDKLLDIAEQEGSDSQIYTWKEVNEQYIN